ncbi:4865_t:CDS:1, partial [Gigaspora margarita]
SKLTGNLPNCLVNLPKNFKNYSKLTTLRTSQEQKVDNDRSI